MENLPVIEYNESDFEEVHSEDEVPKRKEDDEIFVPRESSEKKEIKENKKIQEIFRINKCYQL